MVEVIVIWKEESDTLLWSYGHCGMNKIVDFFMESQHRLGGYLRRPDGVLLDGHLCVRNLRGFPVKIFIFHGKGAGGW